MRPLHKIGLIVATSIPLFVLPARISEGQFSDPVNLIGSEIVIFLMSLACWYTINWIQDSDKFSGLVKVLLSVTGCCLLSNVFYFTFNPLFKDFPFRTVQNPLPIRILMLSSRGILMSIIIIPAAYFLKRDQDARSMKEENDRLILDKFRVENELLEQTVTERTQALQEALQFLQMSQKELEQQSYIQTRLIASITHDIRSPFKFVIKVAEHVARIAAEQDNQMLKEPTGELKRALDNIFAFLKNLLEFTKLPLKEQLSIAQKVSLPSLVYEKATLFTGVAALRENKITIRMDENIHITSNSSLLGIIIHNLLDNANRYSMKSEIIVEAGNSRAEGVWLSVTNWGLPLSKNTIDWFDTGKYDSEVTAERNHHEAGIGLVLIKDISKLLKVHITASSDDIKTVFRIVFPDTATLPEFIQ